MEVKKAEIEAKKKAEEEAKQKAEQEKMIAEKIMRDEEEAKKRTAETEAAGSGRTPSGRD